MAMVSSPFADCRTNSMEPAVTTKSDSTGCPAATRISPLRTLRTSPWAATRAICAGVSLGNTCSTGDESATNTSEFGALVMPLVPPEGDAKVSPVFRRDESSIPAIGPPVGGPASAATAAACGFGAHPLHGVGLLIGVSLFFPWIGVEMIAVDLPESRSVDIQELERADPLGALPEVKSRHDEPAGTSMLRRKLLTIVPESQEDIVLEKVREKDVRRVAPVAVSHDGGRFGPDARAAKNFRDGDALPAIVVPAPPRHAVDVGRDLDSRQLEKLFPGPGHFVVDEAEAPKAPGLQISARRLSVSEDGPLLRKDLPGRQPHALLRFHHLAPSLFDSGRRRSDSVGLDERNVHDVLRNEPDL